MYILYDLFFLMNFSMSSEYQKYINLYELLGNQIDPPSEKFLIFIIEYIINV